MLAAIALALVFAAPAAAKSPVRITPDGTAILVNKDLNGERWAISLDSERATVTGNVFVGDSEEKFLWCGITDAVGDPGDLASRRSCCTALVPIPART